MKGRKIVRSSWVGQGDATSSCRVGEGVLQMLQPVNVKILLIVAQREAVNTVGIGELGGQKGGQAASGQAKATYLS